MAGIYATNDPILDFADVVLEVFREICDKEKVETIEDGSVTAKKTFTPAPEKEERGTKGNDNVNHPSWYGSKDDPYETIKVIEAWGLNFTLGNALKYISRAGKKDPAKTVEDLRKALFYVQYEIDRLEGKKV